MDHVTVDGPRDMGLGSVTSTVCPCTCPRCMSDPACQTTAVGGSQRWPDTITAPRLPEPVFPLWPTDADSRPLVGYWRCACQTIVPPGVEHRCPRGEGG